MFTITLNANLFDVTDLPFVATGRMGFDVPHNHLIDLLAFFNRRELCFLSLSNSRILRIIEHKYAEAPFLLMRWLQPSPYSNGKLYWITLERDMFEVTPEAANIFQVSKFIRFEVTTINCHMRMSQIMWLKRCSHLWANGRLEILQKNYADPSTEMAVLMSQSPDLYVEWNKVLCFLGCILSGPNAERVKIYDNDQKSTWNYPVEKLLRFLFKPQSKNGMPRELYIVARYCPNFAEIFDEIEEKFLKAPTPPIFRFAVKVKCESEIHDYSDFSVSHKKSNNVLQFCTLKNGFVIRSTKIYHNSEENNYKIK
ncbi:hypothetical protein DdX_12031 [Ditylenchus destructor]|uniref:Uncharacterized protein n=1 Tax=Ditylenchus destructor TaxID=166010 RepID=A0AAD4R3T7_9BILA|nr:hypothetical protein DdX_12031 [Ditylenchus destructor]